MTQEDKRYLQDKLCHERDKELLLKDLCARLPYGVKVNEDIQGDFTLIGLTKERIFTTCEVEGCHNDFPIELIKPYLFPISSMTEEQMEEWRGIRWSKLPWDELNWLNEGHWDYRHLIEKGLAIDATGLNIY